MATKRARRGRGEGSVSKRTDGRWVARLNLGIVNGKRRVRDVYGDTKAEALEKLRDEQRKVDVGKSLEVTKLTLGEYTDQWLEAAKHDRSTNTMENFGVVVRRHIKPVIGGVPLRKVAPLHVEAMLAEMRSKGLASATVGNAFDVVKNALNRAVSLRLIDENPCASLKAPKVESAERPTLTPTESTRLLKTVSGDRYEAL